MRVVIRILGRAIPAIPELLELGFRFGTATIVVTGAASGIQWKGGAFVDGV